MNSKGAARAGLCSEERSLISPDYKKSVLNDKKYIKNDYKGVEIVLFKPKGGNIPPTPIQVETEQFISEAEK